MNFSAKELCDIIELASKCGVTGMKVGDFEVSFLPPGTKALEAVATLTPEEQKKAQEFTSEAFLDHEARIRHEELERLRIEDPEQFEELISRGELENAGKGSDTAGVGRS